MRQKVTLSTSTYNISQRGDSLSASGLKVRSIDPLPINLTKGIRQLDLSHNLISKIENIKQFPYLHTLNISHNYISKGSQILKLHQSTKLIKVFVYGNPFLDEPLDEQVLQFLIEKETDIQILNGENLNRIRDLQEGQLKVVFLQNYLKKINYHEQIRSKHFSRSNSQKKSLLSEEGTNRLIINKIMPQFFEIIDDPKIRTKLKKQTIGIKRHEQVSFEDAMMKKKQRQQQQVNNLIKDIFTMVEDQDESKNNHQQYLEEGRRSPEIYEQDEYQMQMEEEDQIKEIDPNYLKLRRKLQRSREKHNEIKSSPSKRNFQSKEMKQTEKNKNTQLDTSQMSKINLITPKNKMSSRISEAEKIQTPENKKVSQSSNFYSFNKIPSIPFNKATQTFPQNKQIFSKTQRIQISKQTSVPKKRLPSKPQIKIQTKEQKTEQKESKIKKPPITPKSEILKSEIKNETKKFDQRIFTHQGFETQKQNPKPYDSIKDILEKPEQQQGNHSIQFSNFLNTSNIDPSDLYQQYYAHLTKYNPTFALLYSDIQSLSPEQKSVLIDALAKDHKSKTIQLFIQRERTKNLKNYSQQNAISHQKQKQQILSKLYEWRQNFNISKQYGEQIQRENARLNSLVKILSQDIKTTKKQNQTFLDQNLKKDGEIRYLQIEVQNKNKQLAHLDKCQQIGEIIKANKKKWRKKQYLKIIMKRAHQYFQIEKWKKNRELKLRNKIINICWSIMKRHLLTQVIIKMKDNEKGENLVKQSFYGWKNYRQQSKINEQKAQRLKKIIKSDRLKQLRKIVGLISSTKKQRKLHKFWATHQFLKSTFYKLIKRTKIQKSQLSQKLKQSITHHNKYKVKQIFLKIKDQTEQTKSNINKTIKMIEKQKKIGMYEKWKILHRNNLIKYEVKNKYQAITRILKLQIEYKNKCQMIISLKNENQELKNKQTMIVKERMKNYFRGFVRNYNKIVENKSIRNKNKQLSMKIVSRNVYRKFVSHKLLVEKIRKFFVKAIKHDRRVQVILQKKQQKLQERLKINKTKQVFYNLTRNMYAERVFEMQVQQRLQQEQTKLLMQKMRTLEQMQIQAIKSQYAKQMQQYHENQMRKDLDYRSSLLQYSNDNRELEDAVMMMRGELEELRNRENAFFKQKQLIEQQVRIAEQGKDELNTMNQNLRMQLSSLSTKYERILELYSQSMFQMQQKGKLQITEKQKQRQRQKQRDKTVQKQKRIGVVKNAQPSSYRYKA